MDRHQKKGFRKRRFAKQKARSDPRLDEIYRDAVQRRGDIRFSVPRWIAKGYLEELGALPPEYLGPRLRALQASIAADYHGERVSKSIGEFDWQAGPAPEGRYVLARRRRKKADEYGPANTTGWELLYCQGVHPLPSQRNTYWMCMAVEPGTGEPLWPHREFPWMADPAKVIHLFEGREECPTNDEILDVLNGSSDDGSATADACGSVCGDETPEG